MHLKYNSNSSFNNVDCSFYTHNIRVRVCRSCKLTALKVLPLVSYFQQDWCFLVFLLLLIMSSVMVSPFSLSHICTLI